ERLPEAAAEALQGPDLALLDELLDLRGLELPAREDPPQREVALLALELLVVLLDDATALRTRRRKRRVVAWHRLALVRLGALDHVARHLLDAAHELR